MIDMFPEQKDLHTISCYTFSKARNLTYCDGNTLFFEAIGLKDVSDLNNLNDYDLPWTADIAQKCREGDLYVLQGNSIINDVQTRWVKDQPRIMIVNKIPIIRDNNSIIGIMGFHYEWQNDNPSQILLDSFNTTLHNQEALFKLVNEKLSCTLKGKEIACLALWVNGYSIKDSASYLYLSNKSIEVYRTSIKEKLSVHHKFQLIDLMQAHGVYHLLSSIVRSLCNNTRML